MSKNLFLDVSQKSGTSLYEMGEYVQMRETSSSRLESSHNASDKRPAPDMWDRSSNARPTTANEIQGPSQSSFKRRKVEGASEDTQSQEQPIETIQEKGRRILHESIDKDTLMNVQADVKDWLEQRTTKEEPLRDLLGHFGKLIAFLSDEPGVSVIQANRSWSEVQNLCTSIKRENPNNITISEKFDELFQRMNERRSQGVDAFKQKSDDILKIKKQGQGLIIMEYGSRLNAAMLVLRNEFLEDVNHGVVPSHREGMVGLLRDLRVVDKYASERDFKKQKKLKDAAYKGWSSALDRLETLPQRIRERVNTMLSDDDISERYVQEHQRRFTDTGDIKLAINHIVEQGKKDLAEAPDQEKGRFLRTIVQDMKKMRNLASAVKYVDGRIIESPLPSVAKAHKLFYDIIQQDEPERQVVKEAIGEINGHIYEEMLQEALRLGQKEDTNEARAAIIEDSRNVKLFLEFAERWIDIRKRLRESPLQYVQETYTVLMGEGLSSDSDNYEEYLPTEAMDTSEG